MNLRRFTQRLEECRKRWHHNTVRYVVGVARIVRAARRAAKDERRWCEWIRNEIHMNRTTVYRYLRVAEFLKSNVDLGQHLASLSIVKLYALSRLHQPQARRLARSVSAHSMSDVAFLSKIQGCPRKVETRATLPNLSKSTIAALARLESSFRRWHQSALTMPLSVRIRLQSRLQAMSRALERMRKADAVAM